MSPHRYVANNNIWNSLILFETRDHVERLFRRKHNRTPSARAITEITSNFIQGREYFSNAQEAGIAVRPLLLYYGVLALSRGLILACDPKMSEASLKPSHGLEIREWVKPLKSKKFGSIDIVYSNGTFNDLLKATDNRSYLMRNSSRINWQVTYDLPPLGTMFSFEDLIKSLPDLADDYEAWTESKPALASWETLDHQDDRYEIKFDSRLSEDIIGALFPKQYCGDLQVNAVNNSLIVSVSDSFLPYITQKWHGPFDYIGDAYIIPPIRGKIYLNLLATYFGLSYILGMMVRYFPATWVSLARVEKGDSFFPLVNKVIDFIQDKYPLAIWDFMNSPYDFERPKCESE